MIMMLVHINQCYPKLECVQFKTWPGTTQPRYTYTKNNHWALPNPRVAFGHPPTTSARTEWQWSRPWRCLSLGSGWSDARRHAWKTSIPRWARYNRYPSLNKKWVEMNFTPPGLLHSECQFSKYQLTFEDLVRVLRVLSKLVVDATRWNDATSTWSQGSWKPPVHC